MRCYLIFLYFYLSGIGHIIYMERYTPNARFLIYPGTYWCGPGDISPDNNTLGPLKHVDACCRSHDRCPDYILPFKSKHGLTNFNIIISLNCQCDLRFYVCLRKINNIYSNDIGFKYFNIFASPCFFYGRAIECVKYRGILDFRCAKYETIENSEMKYRWRDQPVY